MGKGEINDLYDKSLGCEYDPGTWPNRVNGVMHVNQACETGLSFA
jgi:hypothetical protein